MQCFTVVEIAWMSKEMKEQADRLEHISKMIAETKVERELYRLRAEQFSGIAERLKRAVKMATAGSRFGGIDMAVTKESYDVFLMDVYQEDGNWVENERYHLGKLEVTSISGDVDGNDVLAAMKRFTYSDLMGRRFRAIDTTDRRRVYIEDYTGDGSWWEVGEVKGRRPVYGLRLRDD